MFSTWSRRARSKGELCFSELQNFIQEISARSLSGRFRFGSLENRNNTTEVVYVGLGDAFGGASGHEVQVVGRGDDAPRARRVRHPADLLLDDGGSQEDPEAAGVIDLTSNAAGESSSPAAENSILH